MKYKVVKKFSDAAVGDVIELNDRRAKSEIRNGNVVEYKQEKVAYKNKAYKGKKKTK